MMYRDNATGWIIDTEEGQELFFEFQDGIKPEEVFRISEPWFREAFKGTNLEVTLRSVGVDDEAKAINLGYQVDYVNRYARNGITFSDVSKRTLVKRSKRVEHKKFKLATPLDGEIFSFDTVVMSADGEEVERYRFVNAEAFCLIFPVEGFSGKNTGSFGGAEAIHIQRVAAAGEAV